MLYAPERHEPLTDVTWDAARARDAIQAIVAFTGGIGAGVYVADCIEAHARFPIIDGLDTA